MNVTQSSLPAGLLARPELTSGQRDEMFALLAAHFDGVSREQFENDLAEKNWVVQVRGNGRLLGFTTLLVETLDFEGERLMAIYSGDTIVAPEAWQSPMLARAWIAAVNHLRAADPGRRCYWLLLTSGFRTYRFLPVFWRAFYPQIHAVTPPHEQRLRQHLAASRYGAAFDPQAGIVRFPRPQTLRGVLREVPHGRREDADIAFFLTCNPGHERGDELVCLTEISEANLTPAGRRMIGPSSA